MREETPLRALVEAGMALAAELSLDALLERLTRSAAELTGARYAALGVIAPGGGRLERFVVHGIDEETHAAIGDPPQGRGILGVLLREARPLRLHDITADPRSAGFPPNHPPMRSFLGVPILLRGVAYGNLYLTEKEGGHDFTADDEEVVTLLAAQAAIAIENARLYEAAMRWSTRLESLARVGNALAAETDPERVLDLVASRFRELVEARVAAVVLPAGPDQLRFAAVAGEGASKLAGRTIPRALSKSGRLLDERRSERLDSLLDDPEVDQEAARRIDAATGIWVPLVARDRALGMLVAHDRLGTNGGRFGEDDLRLAETFADRAAAAIDVSERVARDVLRRVVAGQEVERRRLARELHDETGQALTSILLRLRGLEDELGSEEARRAAAAVRELAVRTLQDVRRLAVELRPKALDDFGLVAALGRFTESWSRDTGIALDFAAHLGDADVHGECALVLYRIVQEALTNVVKHAQASHVSILLTAKDGRVVAVIEDNGRGFDATGADGFGIEAMRERAQLVGGSLRIESRPSEGAAVVAEVPAA